jgi:hypothetical protein
MSGSLSYLTSLFSSAFGAGDPLLNTLYGGGSQMPGSAGTPVQALQSAELNQTQDIKLTAAQPTVQHTITAFTQAVKGAKSVAQLLANPAVMKVLLTANGMSDQIGYTALVTKVLTSNLKDPNSLANRLSDGRWKTLAQTYDFATNGLKAIQDPKTLATIANGYAQVTWQATQDQVTPGLSNALAFKARASTITSVDQILGDPIMRDVVTTALGVPKQIAFQTLNAQEQAISSRIDLKKFQDPKFVETFVQRYLIANAANNTDSSSSTPDMITLAVQSRSNLF